MFGVEEWMKDENGEFLWKLKGGSEPEVKFSNLDKESSIHHDEEDESEEAEEERSVEFDLSDLNGFLDQASSNSDRE